MVITFEIAPDMVHTLEIEDELIEFALDKPDFIAGEVREFVDGFLGD